MNKKKKEIIENVVIIACWTVTLLAIYLFVFNKSVYTSSKDLSRNTELKIDLSTLKANNSNSNDLNNITLVNEPPTHITLARTKSNKVEILDIEDYILGVVAAEMPNTFELEALKAQAVAIRGLTFSRTTNSSKHEKYNNADLCDDHTCCQAYNPNNINDAIRKAVSETKGVTPLLAGDYAQTLYFASTLEGTLTDKDVWGSNTASTVMYKTLEGPSPESKIMPNTINQYPYSNSTVSLNIDSFIKLVNSNYPSAKLTKNNIKNTVKITSRTKGGYVDLIQLGNISISGSDLRNKLVKSLKSANFSISFSQSNIIFTAKGYGHAVGMSQWGANALAKEGKTYTEILNYYFDNIDLAQIY